MANLIKRNRTYYLQWYTAGKKINRRGLETESYRIASDKLRQFQSAQPRGNANPFSSTSAWQQCPQKYRQENVELPVIVEKYWCTSSAQMTQTNELS